MAERLPVCCAECQCWDHYKKQCPNQCYAPPDPPRPRWCPLHPIACGATGATSASALWHEHHYLKDQGKLVPYFKPGDTSPVPKP